MIVRRILVSAVLTFVVANLSANPKADALVPLKPEVRQVIDASCVMCHGEVFDGEKEIRDDIDFSTDELLRRTLPDTGKLKQVILEDKMPHKPRLSRRLRGNTEAQARLEALRATYNNENHKAVLLDWLKDITATTGDKKE